MEPVRSSTSALAALPSEEVKALLVSNLVQSTRQKHSRREPFAKINLAGSDVHEVIKKH